MPVAQETASYIPDLSFLKSGKKDHVAIICHDQPDADCLASAMAMQSIAEFYGLSSGIYYGGELSHTQNRVMVNVLNISASKIGEDEEDEETRKRIIDIFENSYLVLVDVACFGKQPCETISMFVPKDREPDLVIDHHDLNPKITCNYIRRPYGACSTILFEILEELAIKPSKILATALYLGISTDTYNLKAEGVSDHDSRVFETLKSLIDPETYESIFNYSKPLAIVDMRRCVYNTMSIEGSIAIANAGVVSANQRSLVAEIADELLQIESVETSVVMAIVDEGQKADKWLVASFRSQLLSLNMQDFIGKTFGKKNGGGRKGCGAAKIVLDSTIRCVLDDILSKNSEEALQSFTKPIFQAYAEKIKSENSNI